MKVPGSFETAANIHESTRRDIQQIFMLILLITGAHFNAHFTKSEMFSCKWYFDKCFLYEQYVNIPTTVLQIPLPSSRLFNTGSMFRGTFLLVRWDSTLPEVLVPKIFVFARCNCSTCCQDGSWLFPCCCYIDCHNLIVTNWQLCDR
jgi:hypothetical protein